MKKKLILTLVSVVVMVGSISTASAHNGSHEKEGIKEKRQELHAENPSANNNLGQKLRKRQKNTPQQNKLKKKVYIQNRVAEKKELRNDKKATRELYEEYLKKKQQLKEKREAKRNNRMEKHNT